MNEIEKLNEEIRNYKLFKIQRSNTRIQKFSEFKSDLIEIKKNEILNYIVGVINIISVIFLVYNAINSYLNHDFFIINKSLIFINFFLTLFLSIFLTFKLFYYNFKLVKHTNSVDDAVKYFSSESENLKSVYENYIENYLESIKSKSSVRRWNTNLKFEKNVLI